MLDDRRNRDAIYQANGIPDKITDMSLHSSPNPQISRTLQKKRHLMNQQSSLLKPDHVQEAITDFRIPINEDQSPVMDSARGVGAFGPVPSIEEFTYQVP